MFDFTIEYVLWYIRNGPSSMYFNDTLGRIEQLVLLNLTTSCERGGSKVYFSFSHVRHCVNILEIARGEFYFRDSETYGQNISTRRIFSVFSSCK